MTTADEVIEVAKRARSAATGLAKLPRAAKDAALLAMADALVDATAQVLAANAEDLARGRESGMAEGMLDRLALDEGRVAGMADGLRQVAGLPDPVGEHAVPGAALVGAEHAQPADEDRHLRCRQAEQLRAVDQQLFRRHVVADAQLVAEAVRHWLEDLEAFEVRLLLGRVAASSGERHRHIVPRVARRLLDRRAAAEHDRVGKRDIAANRSLPSCGSGRSGCVRRWRRRGGRIAGTSKRKPRRP